MSAAEVLGKGLYRVPDAARLIDVNASTLRRWLQGYSYTYLGKVRETGPRWESEHGTDSHIIGFLDLIEARVIAKFRREGVQWPTLAAAAEEARKRFDVSHPFATLRLQTDGRNVILEVAKNTGDVALEDIVTSQKQFDPFLRPLLVDLKFEKDVAASWWPLGKEREVVLDPRRSFGKPIINTYGVSTSVLADAVRAEGAILPVSRWFNVSEQAVKDAVDFEKKIAA